MISQKIEQYVPVVGMESLVGIITKGPDSYPLDYGNYMSLYNGPYLANMWSENLKEWVRRNPTVDTIEVTVLSDGHHYLGFVTDERLLDWVNDRMCVTGHGWGSRELCEAAHNFFGIEVGDAICGCEEPSQAPRMITRFSFDSPIINYSCQNCGRSWESTRE